MGLEIKFVIHTKVQKKVRYRSCLKCNEMFESQWIGNRICSDCEQDTTHLEAYPVHYRAESVFHDYHSRA